MSTFKKGDRVRHKGHGYTGRIKAVRDSAAFPGEGQDVKVGHGAWSYAEDFTPAPTKKDRKIARLEAELTALHARMKSQIDSLNVIIDRNKKEREAAELAQVTFGSLPVSLMRKLTLTPTVLIERDERGSLQLEVVMVGSDPHTKALIDAINNRLNGR